MTSARRPPWWMAFLLGALGLVALYAGPLASGFLNDDYLFLEAARTRPLAESLFQLGPLGNYYRPLSQQLYFAVLTPIAGGNPHVFHAVNAIAFAAALALLADLLLAFLPPAGAMAGCLYFAALPFQRVALTWISCSQDLLALLFSLGSLALFRRGRTALALAGYGLALASKEAALALPVALAAWELVVERRGPKIAARRVAPFAALGLVWLIAARSIGAFHSARPWLRFEPEHFVAGYVHMLQSLLGLELPGGMPASLLRHAPSLVALGLLAPLAIWYAVTSDEPRETAPRRAGCIAFASAWLIGYGFVTGPVAATWSGYYYMLAAVGGALIVGSLFRRGDAPTWILLVSGLLWWQAGSVHGRAFALADRPWGWTSHLTTFYFERASALTDTLSRQLRTIEPAPPHDARFYFATLPPWAGFQMGNGALTRNLYRDPTLEAYFYSQFSDTTAGEHPCRFLYWDGKRLQWLYPGAREPFFHVGSDLLLLDRPAGAAHAFRRGLAAGATGEAAMDLRYWLGWAELWRGHRAAAESTWRAFGAIDDSSYWSAHLRAAHNALTDGDTLNARRNLIRAIEYGIGRPEAHAALGQLLMAERPKYATLELKVATWLKPSDWMARRDLALALAGARLDEAARREFAALEPLYPEWRGDSAMAKARRVVEARDVAGTRVARF